MDANDPTSRVTTSTFPEPELFPSHHYRFRFVFTFHFVFFVFFVLFHLLHVQITIAIAFGFGISVLIYGIGHISGGHINPAVTLAFMALGKQSPVAGLLYMASQFFGAVIGSFIVWGGSAGLTSGCDDESYVDGVCASSLKSNGDYGPAFNIGINTVNARLSLGGAFLLELVGTYLLVITVMLAAVHVKSTAGNCAPIAIGWAVMLCHINLVPFTGCGINPARSFGPMIVDSIGGLSSNVWIRGWWIYYTAPFVG